MNGGMIFSSVVICGPGKVRTKNQDNFYLNGFFRHDPSDISVQHMQNNAYDRALYAVADGMGGEHYGETASLIAVCDLNSVNVRVGAESVYHYLLKCNEDICHFIEKHNGERSGTTFVGLCFRDNIFEVINIGDSRAYLLRGNAFEQISRDHTVVQQMLKIGIIAKSELRSHRERHKLTQHLGIFPDEMLIEPYAAAGELEANDLFLLCSDGVHDMLDDDQIKRTLMSEAELEDKAAAIYSAVMEAGGKDNATVMLIRAQENNVDEEMLDQTI